MLGIDDNHKYYCYKFKNGMYGDLVLALCVWHLYFFAHEEWDFLLTIIDECIVTTQLCKTLQMYIKYTVRLMVWNVYRQ